MSTSSNIDNAFEAFDPNKGLKGFESLLRTVRGIFVTEAAVAIDTASFDNAVHSLREIREVLKASQASR